MGCRAAGLNAPSALFPQLALGEVQTFGPSVSLGAVVAGLTAKGGSAALGESLQSCLEGGSRASQGHLNRAQLRGARDLLCLLLSPCLRDWHPRLLWKLIPFL